MTLTTHDSVDFKSQVLALKKRLKRLLRKRKGAWSKVRGIMWWIEPARGAGGRWRSHIHAVVAFDERDAPRSPRCLILKWAHDHRAELSAPWSRDRWESDRKYLPIITHQDIKPLHCYRQSKLSSRVESSCNPVLRLSDVMEVAEYSRTDRRPKSSNPEVRTVPLSVDDRVHITLLGLRLRDCQGVFRGVDNAAKKSLEKQLTAIDRPLSVRRQLHTAALQHPSTAASLIPTPETEDSFMDEIVDPRHGDRSNVSGTEAANGSTTLPQPTQFPRSHHLHPLHSTWMPVTDCHWRRPPQRSGFRATRYGPDEEPVVPLFVPDGRGPARSWRSIR